MVLSAASCLNSRDQANPDPLQCMEYVYHLRLRSNKDRNALTLRCLQAFGCPPKRTLSGAIQPRKSGQGLHIGNAKLSLYSNQPKKQEAGGDSSTVPFHVPASLQNSMEALAVAVELAWPVLLVGLPGSGEFRFFV